MACCHGSSLLPWKQFVVMDVVCCQGGACCHGSSLLSWTWFVVKEAVSCHGNGLLSWKWFVVITLTTLVVMAVVK